MGAVYGEKRRQVEGVRFVVVLGSGGGGIDVKKNHGEDP